MGRMRIALVCADDSQYVGITGNEKTYYALHNAIRVKKNFGYINNQDLKLFSNINYQHRGLLSIAEFLMRSDFDIEFFYNPKGFDPSWHYDVIGFNSNTQNIEMARNLASQAKSRNPKVVTVLGGAHANGISNRDFESEKDFFDFIVKGRGEQAMLSITCALKSGDLKQIDSSLGIYGKNIESRSAISLRELQVSPSILHNAYRFIPVKLPAARIFFSEGCIYKCAFCSNQRHHVFLYDLDSVRQEIDILIENYGTKYIYVGDENFNLRNNRSVQIISLMDSYSDVCKWAFQTRVGIPTKEAIAKLKPESCVEVQFGIESADDHIRELIAKGYGNLADINRALDVYLDKGLNLLAYFIVGLPGETRSTVKKNFEEMCKLIYKGVMVEIGIFVPYPGTPIYEYPSKYGIQIDNSSWSKFRSDGIPPYNYENGLSGEQMRELFEDGLASYIISAYKAKYGTLFEKGDKAIDSGDKASSLDLCELPW